ncbi:hypothetical protein Q5752_001376 [Cryptotrichosporon argae]
MPDDARFTLADYYDRRTYFAADADADDRPPSSTSSRAPLGSPPEPGPHAGYTYAQPAHAPAHYTYELLSPPRAHAVNARLEHAHGSRQHLVRSTSDQSFSGRDEPPIPLTPLEPARTAITPDMKRDDDEKSLAYSAGPARGASGSTTIWQRLVPSSWSSRSLLAVVLFETAINIAIEGNILWRFRQEIKSGDSTQLELENKRRLPVYLCVFGLAHLWQLVLTIDAIRTKNTIQVIGVAIFNAMFICYASLQVSEIRTILGSSTSADEATGTTLLTLPLNVLTYVVIGVIAACELAVVVLSWFVYRDFGWKIYRFLGADLAIKRYYFQYQIFDCICRFSAFFFAGFGIQSPAKLVILTPVLNKTDPEYIITWIMLPLSLVFLIMGILAARYEKRYLMALFELGLLCGCAYFTYKLVRIWQDATTTYAHIATSLTVFSALSILCLIFCAVSALAVWRNFGKGLKAHVIARRDLAPLGSALDVEATPRISID